MNRSSVSFHKKALENKRVRKRKEKHNRKANSGVASLDNKIAFVDKNKIITIKLIEPDEKEKVDVEDIAGSAPKKQEESIILKGHVRHFNKDKGFGFIKDDTNNEKYFFHITDAFSQINESNQVSFELEIGDTGTTAIKIRHA